MLSLLVGDFRCGNERSISAEDGTVICGHCWEGLTKAHLATESEAALCKGTAAHSVAHGGVLQVRLQE